MLNYLEKLIGMPLEASDGEIGKIRDVYFDDHSWTARYLVVETGDWLMGRQVLVSPLSVMHIDWHSRQVRVQLTQRQVRHSPDIDTAKPVSRQHELSFLDYYGYPDYWSGGLLWGTTPFPLVPVPPLLPEKPAPEPIVHKDPHLRSLREVIGYHFEALDGPIGHLQDFLMDSGNWTLRYVVVDTTKWWMGKHVIIPPQWISKVDWGRKTVHLDVSCAMVKHSPEYDLLTDISREYEGSLFNHYLKPGYWL